MKSAIRNPVLPEGKFGLVLVEYYGQAAKEPLGFIKAAVTHFTHVQKTREPLPLKGTSSYIFPCRRSRGHTRFSINPFL